MRYLKLIILLVVPITSFSQCIIVGSECTGSQNVEAGKQYTYSGSEIIFAPTWIATNGILTGKHNQKVTVTWRSSAAAGSLTLMSGNLVVDVLHVNIFQPGPHPVAPNALSQSRCGVGAVTFTAAPGNGETTPITSYKWYRADGTQISGVNGPTYVTNPLDYSNSLSESYSVSAVNSSGEGARTYIEALFNPIPASPTGLNASRCDVGTMVLNGTPGSNANNVKWYTQSSGGVALATSNSYTTPWLNNSTTYYISSFNTLTNCESVSGRTPVTATIVPLPTAANAGPDQTGPSTCGVTSVSLAGNVPAIGVGNWTVINGSGGSFGNASSASSTFNGVAGSSYTLRWTITNGSCAASFDDVVITFNRNPTTANAGPDQTGPSTCGATSVSLAGNVPAIGVGNWSIISGSGGSFGNASSASSTFNGVAGSSYTLRWTITYGFCSTSSFDDVVITFNRNPTAANAGPDQTGSSTCGATSVSLAGNVPAIGLGNWSIVSGIGGSFGNASSASSTFNGVAGSTYTVRWTITTGFCPTSSFDDAVVTFNRNPTAANAGPDQTGPSTCGATRVSLAGNVPAIGAGNWSVISGSGGSFENASSASSTFNGVAGSSYTLRWTITTGFCPTTSFDDVVVKFNNNIKFCVNMNYILSNTILVEKISENQNIEDLTIGQKSQSIQYFDGLVRPIQSVITQGSPDKSDIVQQIQYDAFGREARKYLPFVHGNNGWYKKDAQMRQMEFYHSNNKVATDPKPYSETIFEPSPLNRVVKQGAPGAAWQPDADPYSMSDRTVKKRYELNLANEVMLLTYNPTTGLVEGITTFYGEGQLYANKTYDEHNNEVFEYVDKEGRTVCKKVKASSTEYACTYYIYDDFGNLVVVLPPEAVKKLTN